MVKRERNKKAQFYLVATIIIVALFLSFVSLLNYSVKKDNPNIKAFAEELNAEGEWVLDYEEQTGNSVFGDFAKSYTYYVGGDKEIYFIYGPMSNIQGVRYDGENPINLNPSVAGGNASIEVEGKDYTFKLEPGQNFYFVMTDKYKDQEYFITNTE